MRANHRARLPEPDLRHAVPGTVLLAMASERGRHGAGVQMASRLSAAPAVTSPARALGPEIPGSPLVFAGTSSRVPRRAAGSDASRPASHRRVAVLAASDLA